MPQELRQFFGLRSLTAGEAGVDEVDGIKVGPEHLVHPRIAVVPMGWSWAMYWCQHINERLCEEAGLTPEERLRDGEPVKRAHSGISNMLTTCTFLGQTKQWLRTAFGRQLKG